MSPIGRLIFWLVMCATVLPAGAEAVERRIALVIGNAEYENAPPLSHPVRDAAEVAAVLERLGFAVDLQTDLRQAAMQNALRNFGYAAPSADVALVFFSGHGIQVAGVSYLLPIDAALRRERDLLYEAIPLDLVLGEIAQARGLGLVILDAARENPLAEGLRQALGPIGAQRIEDGIGRVDNLPSETLVALSTRPGTTSIITDSQNSPYVAALLEHIDEPGLELDFLFRQVRDTVLQLTRGRQEPRTYDALGAEPFYFRERPNRPPVIGRIQPLEVFDDAAPTPLGLPPPSDPDGDQLIIKVTGVPEHGDVRTDQQVLSEGDRLEMGDFAQLRYVPPDDFTGQAGAFDLMIEDERGAATGAMLPIVVKSSNRPPVVPDRRQLMVSSVPLNIQTPIDPDGDQMTVVVRQLPQMGVVRDGGRIVQVGDKLSIPALAGLVVVTEEGGAFGTFAFDVVDERGGRSSSRLDIALSTSLEPGTRGQPAAEPDRPAPNQAVPEPEVTARATPVQPRDEPATGQPPPTGAEEVAPDEEEQQKGPPIYRTIRMSNIRSAPSIEGERVVTVPPDTLLKVTGRADGAQWLEVETEEGETGFIYFALVQPVTMTPA
ncbi:MAG: caspase family protein, partial [Geminicoccaceae bacterium]|nr:caspase family protein [Geminicoccaceae bacterium]